MSVTYQPKRQPCPPDIARKAKERGTQFVEAMTERQAIMWVSAGASDYGTQYWQEAYDSTVNAMRPIHG